MIKKNTDFEKLSLFKSAEESPGYLLWRVSMQWRSIIEKVLKSFDLTHPQFVVLITTGWLTKNEENVSQAVIGKFAGLDPNTTSQIIRGLEAKKLIKRMRTVDERSKNPVLTRLGLTVLEKALPAVEKTDLQFFASLDSQESHALLYIFQKLISKT